MRVPVLMPELGLPDAEVGGWCAEIGDEVIEGDRLVEVVVRGAAVWVSAPVNGRLAERRALRHDRVRAGEVLGLVEAECDADSW